jgi:hypothetical protein
MACKTNNQEEFENLIRNKEHLFDTHPNQTQSETVENLEFTNNRFAKVNGLYTSGNTSLAKTITTEIGKEFKEKVARFASDETKAKWNQQAEMGTLIHGINESIGKNILSQIPDTFSNKDSLNLVKNIGFDKIDLTVVKQLIKDSGYSVDDKILARMFEGVKQIFIKTYSVQNTINNLSKSDGKVNIKFEQVIVDTKKDIGGTADFVAIYSDNTASVIDFKTKIIYWENIGSNGLIKPGVKWLNASAKENYKLQLGEISRILRERYGVKKVNTKSIEFIRLSANYNKTTKSFNKKIENVWYGEKQDPSLKQLKPFAEQTPFTDLNEFLLKLDKKIELLKEKLAKDKTNQDKYNEQIEQLESARYDIVSKMNFKGIFEYTEGLLQSIVNIDQMSLSELREAIDELKTLEFLSQSTYEFRKYIKSHLTVAPVLGKDKDGKDIIGKTGEEIADEIEGKTGSLHSIIVDKVSELEEELFNNRVGKLVDEETGFEIFDETGHIIPFNDEGFFGKWFYQLSHFENPIFQTFRSVLSKAQYDNREDLQKVIKNVQDKNNIMRNWMKQNNKDNNWLIDLLIDKNKGNLTEELSNEWKKVRADLKENPEGKKISQFYEPTDRFKQWYQEKLAEQTDDIKKADFKKKYNIFDPNNNDAWRYVFLNKQFNLKIKDSVRSKYKSTKFAEIEKIPEVFAFYKMLTDYNKEFRDILGVEYLNLPDTFIPNIRKDTIEKISNYGFMEGTKQSFQDALANLNVREDETMYGELEDGKLKRRIPKFYLNNLRNAKGDIDNTEKSYELDKSLILFAKMAYNYKNMHKIEAEVLSLRDFMANKGEEFIKRGGKNLSDYVGNTLSSKIGDNDIMDRFNNFVDMYLYGISIEPTLGDKSGKFEKLILKAKQYYTVRSLGFNFIAAGGSYLAAKTNAVIEGSKGIIYTTDNYKDSLVSSWKERDKFLALTAFFDPMGLETTQFSLDKSTKSKIGDQTERNFIARYVNTRTLLRTFSLGDEHIDEVITSSMARNYYIDDFGNVKIFKNEIDREKYKDRTVWNMFNYTDGKAELKGLNDEQKKNVIIAFREAVQAGQSRIKGVIPEEDKAAWQSQILGQVVMHFKSWMPAIIRERFGKVKYNRALQVVEMGKYIALGQEFSNTDKLATTVFIQSVLIPKLGKFILHLATFGKLGTVYDRARKLKAFNDWLQDNPHYKNKITYEEWLNVQEKQVKSMMIELRILLTIAAIIMMLNNDWDDDGEKDFHKYWLSRKIAALLSKTQQEISFTYNPEEFAKMIKNPIPMIGLATDSIKALKNTFDESTDAVLGENSESDKTPFFYYGHKLIPGAQGLTKFWDIFHQDSGQSY